MVLEPPSDITIKTKEEARVPLFLGTLSCLMNSQAEEQVMHLKPSELALVGGSNADPVKKKRRGPKGPNPLSVKKKQVIQPSQDNRDVKRGEKRKRDALIDGDTSGSTRTKRRRRKKQTAVNGVQDTGSVTDSVISK